jgi:hypothetical protein
MLYDEIKDKKNVIGLCFEISKLKYYNIITLKENNNLVEHFESQKPNKNLHSEFLKSETWSGIMDWWKEEENYNPINRKLFIKKLVEITGPATKK